MQYLKSNVILLLFYDFLVENSNCRNIADFFINVSSSIIYLVGSNKIKNLAGIVLSFGQYICSLKKESIERAGEIALNWNGFIRIGSFKFYPFWQLRVNLAQLSISTH